MHLIPFHRSLPPFLCGSLRFNDQSQENEEVRKKTGVLDSVLFGGNHRLYLERSDVLMDRYNLGDKNGELAGGTVLCCQWPSESFSPVAMTDSAFSCCVFSPFIL